MMARTPMEALEAAIWRIHMTCTDRYRRTATRPGQLIEELPESHRELLRRLKSDDARNVRPDALIGL